MQSYLAILLTFIIAGLLVGVGLVHITKGNLERIEIPIPELAVQEAVADALDSERALVEANRKLVEIFENKIQVKLAEIWGEEKTI